MASVPSHRSRVVFLWIGISCTLAFLGMDSALTARRSTASDRGTDALALGGAQERFGAEHLVAFDLAHDARGGRRSAGDLLALYAKESAEDLVLRADLAAPDFPARARRPLDVDGAELVFLIHEGPIGALSLPGSDWTAPAAWQRAVVVQRLPTGELSTQVHVLREARLVAAPEEIVAPARLASRYDIFEVRLRGSGSRSSRTAASSPSARRYSVVTLVDGVIEDEIAAQRPGTAPAGAHNIAFVQHGNQGLTWTTVFRGERGEAAAFDGDPNNPDDGFDELLAAHDYYDLPGCFHLAATLQSSAAWHDPDFNAWMAQGVGQGWIDPVTSAYAQHMMPFVRDEMNSWAVDIERDMTNWRYGGNAVVAWVPERVWLDNPDSDGNGIEASAGVIDWIGDDFLDNGVQAVLLDDEWHCAYKNNVFDDHHVYTIGNGLKIIPIDNTFVGQVNWNWGDAWNRIIGSTSDELIVYGNDWEFAAEVSQGAMNPDGLNNYIKILQLASQNSGTVSTWRLSDAIHEAAFGGGSILLQNATYGLLGAHGGYGGNNNSWYIDWASYTGPSNLDAHVPKWNYGQIWDNAIGNILAAPNNALSQSAWYVLMTNLHETGWHDAGEISGWQNHYSNHMKNANVFSEASRWADGQYAQTTGASLGDIDEDGTDEAILYNDRLFVVFESIGGKAQWVFAKTGSSEYSVISNDNVYWVDTDGDYNETNHVAALSDVSVRGFNHENDLYGMSVVSGNGPTLELRLTHPDVEKRVKLELGDAHLEIVYDTFGDRAYVKSGFTPDLIDLVWNGASALARIWDPDATGQSDSGYFGQRNTNTGATAAIVVGDAGAQHNLQASSTLLEIDEIFGDGVFEIYLYAGPTSPPDGRGHIPELVALRDQLTDTIGPDVVSASYFPTPQRLTLRFNQRVRFDNVVLTSIAIDDDNDDVPDLTLTAGESIITAQNSTRIDIDLAPGTASALETLDSGSLELQLAPGAFTDTHVNSNPNLAITAADDKSIRFEAATLITIDGRIDPAEWSPSMRIVDDPGDSQWTSANEIDALYLMWDETYLYLGIDGQVSGNSWILYLDTDVGGANGQVDLTAIDTWERGANFSAQGFRPDYQWGTYQHQGGFDSSSLWQLTSATTSLDQTPDAIVAFDAQHLFGAESGSEIAIPWETLYGLGPGLVPAGTAIGLVTALCWDPEPDGVLGGDVAPNNKLATLPEVDSFYWLPIDKDHDGRPDPDPTPTAVDDPTTATPGATRLFPARPNPFNPRTQIAFAVGGVRETREVRLIIHDVRGQVIRTLLDGVRGPGRYELWWDGRDDHDTVLASGVYFARLQVAHEPDHTTKLVLLR